MLKRQKMVSSGAGLVSFCGFARHLLAGFLSPTELVRTARGCMALRYTLRGWLSWDGLSFWGWSLQECLYHVTLQQCLICLHVMRMSSAQCEVTSPVSSGGG